MIFGNLLIIAATASSVSAIAMPQRPGPCTRELRPVCGNNGHFYSNKCVMKNDEQTQSIEFVVKKVGQRFECFQTLSLFFENVLDFRTYKQIVSKC